MKQLEHTLPLSHEYQFTQSLTMLDQEERAIVSKQLAEFLGQVCTPGELLKATSRVSHLYTRARVHQITGQLGGFRQSEVDVISVAALIALEEHPDPQTALRVANSLRKDRNASTMNHSSHISPIHDVGIQTKSD